MAGIFRKIVEMNWNVAAGGDMGRRGFPFHQYHDILLTAAGALAAGVVISSRIGRRRSYLQEHLHAVALNSRHRSVRRGPGGGMFGIEMQGRDGDRIEVEIPKRERGYFMHQQLNGMRSEIEGSKRHRRKNGEKVCAWRR